MFSWIPMEIDVTPITGVIADLATAVPTVITPALGVAASVFALTFLFRKGKQVVGA